MSNTILSFTATWCVPCKNMKSVVEKLPDPTRVISYDIDSAKDMFELYKVQGVPTFVVLDADGEEVQRIVGSTTYEKLASFL